MEVEIISETCIKPSSPTPPHLKTYRFSSIDQRATSSYIPTILFLNPPPPVVAGLHTDETISSSLKWSLSETLPQFYPLAGRTNPDGDDNNFSINCTDDGVRYIEAKLKDPSLTLSQYLNHDLLVNGLATLKKLFPLSDAVWMYCPPSPASHIAHLQVTFFPCGGLAIGSVFSHKIVDAPTLSSFFQAWAAATSTTAAGSVVVTAGARDDSLFCAESVFPQDETFVERAAVPSESKRPLMLTRALTVPARIRRFVFNASAIASLKEKLSKPIGVTADTYCISRVQVVTALLTKSILRAFRARSDTSGTTLIVQPVNLRSRANPPLPVNSFGNLTMRATFRLDEDEDEDEEEDTDLRSLVKLMKDSVSRINGELIRRIRGVEGKAEFAKVAEEMDEEEENAERHLMCNSFSQLGYYEVDFGWGKPAWMACLCCEESDTAVVNLVLLNDTKSEGDGLEAWVLLGVDDMAILENDEELMSLVSSVDPSPLD